jgi:hypothetical protein
MVNTLSERQLYRVEKATFATRQHAIAECIKQRCFDVARLVMWQGADFECQQYRDILRLLDMKVMAHATITFEIGLDIFEQCVANGFTA